MKTYTVESLRQSVAAANAKPDRKYFSLTAKQGEQLLADIQAVTVASPVSTHTEPEAWHIEPNQLDSTGQSVIIYHQAPCENCGTDDPRQIACAYSAEDGKLIVRAVNSHAQLVAALEAMLKADTAICENIGLKSDQAMQRIAALDMAVAALASAQS
jgi:hypothetical protein